MQPIHISRYEHPDKARYQGTVAPEDRSWILFIALDGEPQLFVRCSFETDDGKTEHGYVPATAMVAAPPHG